MVSVLASFVIVLNTFLCPVNKLSQIFYGHVKRAEFSLLEISKNFFKEKSHRKIFSKVKVPDSDII